MAPLARGLGWHPDFALTDLLRSAEEASSIEECPPVGLFTLVKVPN
jgi:phosphatidylethanolamine/phosphatidyl-N-methylethanolamine N-methyltransferase